MRSPRRSTVPGEHRPVLLREVLDILCPVGGQILVDGTIGWGGHAVEFLRAVGPTGRLIGIDLDRTNLDRARQRLQAIGSPFSLQHGNFAGLESILADMGIGKVDGLLLDLGMSSMQLDDPERGFSYVRDGPLDMRLDPSRGRSAAEWIATVSKDDLRRALAELADEPRAAEIARAIVEARSRGPIVTTAQLADVVCQATGAPIAESKWRPRVHRDRWILHPAARTFQALRILVNRELANLQALLRSLSHLLKPGGVAAIISFHSGEDRLVKSAFREGMHAGDYEAISPDPILAGQEEKLANPRSRSAKLRWARRSR